MKQKVLPKLIPVDIAYCFQYMQSESVFLLYSDFFFFYLPASTEFSSSKSGFGEGKQNKWK